MRLNKKIQWAIEKLRAGQYEQDHTIIDGTIKEALRDFGYKLDAIEKSTDEISEVVIYLRSEIEQLKEWMGE